MCGGLTDDSQEDQTITDFVTQEAQRTIMVRKCSAHNCKSYFGDQNQTCKKQINCTAKIDRFPLNDSACFT